MNRKRLAIYLNDHLTGATAGLELARRARASNQDNDLGAHLDALIPQLEDDRDEIKAVLSRHGLGEDRLKQIGGLVAERTGRLKPNGQLTGYSPLSRLIELDALRLGAEARAGMWRSLAAAGIDGPDYAERALRAERQRAELESHRAWVASEALA